MIAFPTTRGIYRGDNFLRYLVYFYGQSNTPYEPKIEVVGFKMEIETQSKDIETFDISGRSIPVELKQKILTPSKGQKVTFQDFKIIVGCEDAVRTLKDKIQFEWINEKFEQMGLTNR